ncbi:hypothetical protein HNI00_08740 [Thermoleptolyngbya oregonensis NK1-22]|uniref:Uncharacterized protein n=1 Tax=Thermoleptolyngbya oregonensis NK1-22 TaxID=2547457 RepID=A0AA96YAR9_9CYAN|nr:hypothetical protein [Thermoleptolyngbya oregonensis]WOB43235.1 hypothetical protein HNI00_08740 [Thermoleptolyngbya oregonensis NK1-22]
MSNIYSGIQETGQPATQNWAIAQAVGRSCQSALHAEHCTQSIAHRALHTEHRTQSIA